MHMYDISSASVLTREISLQIRGSRSQISKKDFAKEIFKPNLATKSE